MPSSLADKSPVESGTSASHEPATLRRKLEHGEILIKKHDRKAHLYRVESGVLCVYDPRWNGHQAVIEFAFPGDFVGLGFLDHHTLSARAVVETKVACFPLGAMDRLVRGNARAEAKLAEAIEREFEERKASLIEAGRQRPIERVAAFLVAVSRNNTREGRDATVIAEAWPCKTVATFLDMSVDLLAVSLADLKSRGLIEAAVPDGIRVSDLDALEELALGLDPPQPLEGENLAGEVRAPPRVYRDHVRETPAQARIERAREAYLSRGKATRAVSEAQRGRNPLTPRRHSEADRGCEREPRPALASPPTACERSV
jgi:CRP/FNR family transcriptional regulator